MYLFMTRKRKPGMKSLKSIYIFSSLIYIIGSIIISYFEADLSFKYLLWISWLSVCIGVLIHLIKINVKATEENQE